jgi:hypothetical protein
MTTDRGTGLEEISPPAFSPLWQIPSFLSGSKEQFGRNGFAD